VIVTLTPNPSLDRTLAIPRLVRGAVLRATSGRVDPGGKGVNVARVLLANGHPALAVLPTGGGEGRQLTDLLGVEGVPCVGVPIAGAIRANTTVAEPDGTVTKLNETGPELTPDEVDRLLAETVREDADWVAGCGSLPPAAPANLYARLVSAAHDRGVRAAVDTSGPPLAAVVEAGPDLVKPNAEELAELAGRDLPTLGDVAAAARELLDRGVGAVLVSLGGDGALLVTAREVVAAQPPRVTVASTVGAGDATLAGYLAAGTGDAAALAEAVSWGAAAVALPGTVMPGPADLDRVRPGVRLDRDPDLTRPLHDGRTDQEDVLWPSPSTT
jgi:1-phosphofructokinase